MHFADFHRPPKFFQQHFRPSCDKKVRALGHLCDLVQVVADVKRWNTEAAPQAL
jgi:hypothetical protein